jgi:hypothetical protein
MSLLNLTAQQLRLAADLKDKIVALEKQLAGITGTQATPAKTMKPAKRKGGMSAAGRAKVAAAQKARWAKIHAAKGKATVNPVKKARKKMSAAAKAKISAAAKARWAKVRAEKK